MEKRMATNGISTHTPKSERRDLKIAVALAEREVNGTPGYRPYCVYNSPGTVSPTEGHPWEIDPDYTSGIGSDAIGTW